MTEGKKTTTRITAAQVDTKVDALAEAVDALSTEVVGLTDGIGSIVEMLTEQRAAQLISEAAEQAKAEVPPQPRDNFGPGQGQDPLPQKAPVGSRDGDTIVRNLHNRPIRVRIGREDQPYRINLERRGEKGDTTAIPAALRSDLNYKNNLGVAFEEISDAEFDALRGRRRSRRVDPITEQHRQNLVVTQDADRTVAVLQDTTPQDRLSQIGPRYKDVPGSRNPSNEMPELTSADAEFDPEYREFLRFKAAQRATRQDADLGDARVSGRTQRDPVESALRSDDAEARAMAAYIRKMESGGRAGDSATGVIPKGELSKPVVFETTTVSVQPNRHTRGL